MTPTPATPAPKVKLVDIAWNIAWKNHLPIETAMIWARREREEMMANDDAENKGCKPR